MIDVRISQGSAWETSRRVRRVTRSSDPLGSMTPGRRRDLNSKVTDPSSLDSRILERAELVERRSDRRVLRRDDLVRLQLICPTSAKSRVSLQLVKIIFLLRNAAARKAKLQFPYVDVFNSIKGICRDI